MDVWMIVASALLLIWPLQYRRSIRRIRERIEARGGDTDRFERAMDGPWIRIGLVVAPITGTLLIVLGVMS